MKYAIIQSGGKQYKAVEGKELVLDKFTSNPEESYTNSNVVLLRDGEDLLIGKPYVDGAHVEGKVLGDTKGEKVHIYKFKSKVRYRRKTGFRAKYTNVIIEKIIGANSREKQIKNAQTTSKRTKNS